MNWRPLPRSRISFPFVERPPLPGEPGQECPSRGGTVNVVSWWVPREKVPDSTVALIVCALGLTGDSLWEFHGSSRHMPDIFHARMIDRATAAEAQPLDWREVWPNDPDPDAPRILVVGDLHQRLDHVEHWLRQGSEHIIFLGDYFDATDDTSEDARASALGP